MTKTILEAHMRMLSTLPVRTHRCALPSEGRCRGQRISDDVPPKLLDEFARLMEAGLRHREIARAMRIGSTTFKRLRLALTRKANGD